MTHTQVAAPAPATRVPPAAGTRFPCFDGYRALAAMAVLVYHVGFDSGFVYGHHPLGIGFLVCRLEIGVAVFFLVSGFLLYRPFVAAHLDHRPAPNLRSFARRRLLRIVPAYWAALTVGVFVLGLAPEVRGITRLPIFYGFAQIYFPKREVQGIGQAWSLCTEVSFYMFLPVYAWLLGRRQRSPRRQLRAELAGVAILYVSSLMFRLLLEVFLPERHEMKIWLLSTTDLFALGMVLAVLSAWYSQREEQPRISAHRLFPAACWLAAAFAYWVVSIPLDLFRYPAWPISFPQELGRQALYGIVAFFLILPGVFGPQERGRIRRFLQLRPVQLVGLISYGIYLWHPWVITELLKWMDHAQLGGDGVLRTAGGDRIPVPVVLVAIIAISLAVGAISYLVVERPFLRLKRR